MDLRAFIDDVFIVKEQDKADKHISPIGNIMYPKRYYDSYIMYTQIVIDNPKMSLRLSHRR